MPSTKVSTMTWATIPEGTETVCLIDAAAVCGITTQGLALACRNGWIKATRKASGQRDWEVNLEALRNWQENRCRAVEGILAFRPPA